MVGNGIRVTLYLAVAVIAIVTARHTRAAANQRSESEIFWYAIAAIFVGLAFGRATGWASDITSHFRQQARRDGWWWERRRLQIPVVAALCGLWLIAVAALAARSRITLLVRYRWMVLLTISLIAFAAVRLLSLHQVDSLLYDKIGGGPTRSATVEVVMLVLAITVAGRSCLEAGRHRQPPVSDGATSIRSSP